MKLSTGNKIVLIGADGIDVAYAYSLVNQGTVDHLAIINIDGKKTMGNIMNLNHGMVWVSSCTKVTQGMYANRDDAALMVIYTGTAQKPGETCPQLMDENMEIMRSVVDSVVASDFDGLLLITTGPVDVLTYAVWKYSGLPHNRIFSSDTILDTARFRYMLGECYDVPPMSAHIYIIGEHGDSELPALSSANAAGVSLSKRLAVDPTLHDKLEGIFIRARDAAYEIIDTKGSTSYGIDMELTRITCAIFQNQGVALPVSTYLQGEYGHEDMFIGTPAVVNRRGIHHVIELELGGYETEQPDKSVQMLRDVQDPFWK